MGLIFPLQLSIIAALKPVMVVDFRQDQKTPVIVLGRSVSAIGTALLLSYDVIIITLSIVVFAVGASMSTAATASSRWKFWEKGPTELQLELSRR